MQKNSCKVKSVESFNVFSDSSNFGISYTLGEMTCDNRPVVVCIGSDLVLGDSLGPLVGTFLKSKKTNAYIYGTLSSPITAKEVVGLNSFLRTAHPYSMVIAVDAAVGEREDVGVLRVIKSGLKPGLGVNKNLDVIGDVSIIGIVAKKSQKNFELFNATRLGLVYKMAEKIALGIDDYVRGISINKRAPKSISI